MSKDIKIKIKRQEGKTERTDVKRSKDKTDMGSPHWGRKLTGMKDQNAVRKLNVINFLEEEVKQTGSA